MKAVHVIPGLDDPTCGIAVAAKMLVKRGVGAADETWVHSMWTPRVLKASFKALREGRKLVRMPHGCTDPVKLCHRWWKKMWVAPLERWLFRRADRIVATCADEVEWIRRFEPGVKKIELVSLAGDMPAKPLGKVHDPLRLLFVGRLHPLKGLEYLVEAIAALDKESQSANPSASTSACTLRIVGKDEGEGAKLRAMAAEHGLDVEFAGVVSEDEKERAWEWCDVLVLPTLSENFGLVVAEALERGKRVITTDGAPVWDTEGSGGMGEKALVYLKGYRDGTREERVRLLKEAIGALKAAAAGVEP